MKKSIYSPEFLKIQNVLDWGYVEGDAPSSLNHFNQWIQKKDHGDLSYLADERAFKRQNLKNIYPAFESAIVFLFDYRATKKWLIENKYYDVAAYTLGFEGYDYHFVLKRYLENLFGELKKDDPTLDCFISLDAQPVLERDLAYRAGLGWFGKNSMIINQKHGSYFLIGSLLLNKKLQITQAQVDSDHCGQCNLCIDACPTQAIDPVTRTLKANLCISTYTIEVFKEKEAPVGFSKSRGEIFGCDICQDVCPWNKKTLQTISAKLNLDSKLFFLKEWFFEMPKEKFLQMLQAKSNREYKKDLEGTAFARPGRVGMIKNLKALFSRPN